MNEALGVALSVASLSAAVVLLVLAAQAGILPTWRRRIEREVTCPRTGRPEQATIDYCTAHRVWMDVDRCTRFIDPTKVECGRQCLTALNREAWPG